MPNLHTGSVLWTMVLILALVCLPSVLESLGAANTLSPGGEPGETAGQVIGAVSTALRCLASGSSSACEPSGRVHLVWSGEIERARLVLHVAGAEAAHTIRVNGQPAVSVPVLPTEHVEAGEYVYLSFPRELVVQGENQIELTDDALPGDHWTATYVRIEVFGRLSGTGSMLADPD